MPTQFPNLTANDDRYTTHALDAFHTDIMQRGNSGIICLQFLT